MGVNGCKVGVQCEAMVPTIGAERRTCTKSTALLVLQVLRKIETRMGIVLRVMRKAETRMGLSCILCKCYQVACSACACAETRQRTAGRKTHWVYTQPKAVVVCSV